MADSRSKGTLILFALAIVYFLGVLWWKRDDFFGGNEPKPSKGNNVAKKAVDPNAPKISVRVVDDKTGKPIEGARVLIMTRQSTVLSDDKTDAAGSVVARPSGGVMQGTVAYHEDYEIRGLRVEASVAEKSGVELRLSPVTRFRVDVDSAGSAQARWRRLANEEIRILYDPINPFQAKDEYLAYRANVHLGLAARGWPVTGKTQTLPRYLNHAAKLVMYARPKHPNHLDISALRSPSPILVEKMIPLQLGHTELASTATTARLEPLPTKPDVLIAHYRRQPTQKGAMMIQLSFTGLAGSEESGTLVSFTTDYSSFEEKDGEATFHVFDMHENVFQPTLIFAEPGKPVQTIRCNPIEVKGETEVTLTPYEDASLTVRLVGEAGPATENSSVKVDGVILLDGAYEATSIFPTQVAGKRQFEWVKVPPVTSHVFARGPNRVSGPRTVHLKPGAPAEIELTMKPVCSVTLVIPRTTWIESLTIRSVDEGWERSYPRGAWEYRFHAEMKEAGKVFLSSRAYSLDLPQGTYSLLGNGKELKRVVLDSPTRQFELGAKNP